VNITREGWLDAAINKLRPIFSDHGYPLPDIRVSVGWPSKGGLANKKRVIGQCWFGATAADGKPQLFISPLLEEVGESGGVLPTLVHEVCHVAAGPDAKHGPRFVKVMKALGLTGKPTATIAGEELLVRLRAISTELGPFPHSKLVPIKDYKPQSTRMIKCACAQCGYQIRLTRKWLEVGIPECPVDSHGELEQEVKE
jgi:hypothetical protein